MREQSERENPPRKRREFDDGARSEKRQRRWRGIEVGVGERATRATDEVADFECGSRRETR